MITLPEKREVLSTAGASLVGLFIGGLIWGSTETVTKYQFEQVEVEKVVEVEKIVKVEVVKEVYAQETCSIDKEEIEEKRGADGTLTIITRRYGLNFDSSMGATEKSSATESESSKTREKSSVLKEESTIVKHPMINSLSFKYVFRYDSILGFDYKKDWVLEYNRYLPDTPFYGSLFIGPQFFGGGFGFSF